MPPLPNPDAEGNYPAVEYARASLARKIIRDRALKHAAAKRGAIERRPRRAKKGP